MCSVFLCLRAAVWAEKNPSKSMLNENDIKLSNMDNILRFTRGYDRIKVT